MRIRVLGSNPTSLALRGNLALAGFRLETRRGVHGTGYTVEVLDTEQPYIIVDGIDSEFERHIINCISGLTSVPILLSREDGVRSDRAISICVPDSDQAQRAVELGVMRALLRTIDPHSYDVRLSAIEDRLNRKPWWKRILTKKLW